MRMKEDVKLKSDCVAVQNLQGLRIGAYVLTHPIIRTKLECTLLIARRLIFDSMSYVSWAAVENTTALLH